MFFHVDESDHTGQNLFDATQPMLYYGVLCSPVDLDLVAVTKLAALRRRLGVARLHATELGNRGLSEIASDLAALQRHAQFRFDFYRLNKPDHAVLTFFDQVFDVGMNPADTWTGYWTPLRFLMLLRVASLFDEELARAAWAARIDHDAPRAEAALRRVCQGLLDRIDQLQDARSRQVIGDALRWAADHAPEISYNADDRTQAVQISPNVIGFQSVMAGIARRIERQRRQAVRIVVDQQTQFNRAQRTLADFYHAARGMGRMASGPGLPGMELTHMPRVPIEFASSNDSAGLELVDLHLWTFKRYFEEREVAPEILHALARPQLQRGRTDEISLRAIAHRWQ